MMLLPCPWCGPRNVTEFRYGGRAVERPDPGTTSPERWRRYLHLQKNPLGWDTENWYHSAGCRRYFAVQRHTGTNEVRAGEAST
ncbi:MULTISPECIES: sarcosine oxidase subunit delta [Pseudonocardia]|uniref:Sarcosine oxidase, delta subunit family n=2 Tax=Pseudonocardia TaxID=1847 RepID=A0A1Y2MR69_PSEAH|nr:MULTISPECIES: sarcosine oxidase subunit delta [Pseudonocardia]OSY37724.1 Sarcosine oxidase, delta subunit family [Pseudonocardia autotrophica]TDN75786.1 N-methylglutamate dehydrogenase subunit B [Pseudonocardia autotrophica]GEC27101.1 sarcosine oxidase subunit delta [Pseudonocardia saturnea]